MRTNYYAAVNWLHKGLVLCNNLPEVDPSVYENVRTDVYGDNEDPKEIFQWYITDFNADEVEWLEQTFPDLIFTYSDLLDVFVLCVDFYGMSWKGVMIECTNEECVREQFQEI